MNEHEPGMTRRSFISVAGIAGAGIGLSLRHRLAPPAMADASRPATHPEEEIIVGLDCGESNIRVILAGVQPGGAIRIMGRAMAPSRGIRQGIIVDAECARNSVTKALVKAEVTCDVMIQSGRTTHGRLLAPTRHQRISRGGLRHTSARRASERSIGLRQRA